MHRFHAQPSGGNFEFFGPFEFDSDGFNILFFYKSISQTVRGLVDQVHVYFSGTDGYGALGSDGVSASCMRLSEASSYTPGPGHILVYNKNVSKVCS